MMAEKKQVNIRVPKATKKEWAEHAQERYGSMTRLITQAVNREIHGHHDATGDGETPSNGVVDDMATTVDRLENTVRDMDKRLSAVHETVQSTGPDISIKAAIRETLPTVPDSALVPDGEHGEEERIARPDEGGPDYDDWALTAKQVAARLNGEESTIKQELEELSVESPEVESQSVGEETFYYRQSEY